MQKVTFWFLWLLVFFIPLESLLLLDGLGTLTRILGLLALVTGLLSVAKNGQLRFPGPVFLLCMLFFLWTFVGYAWAVSQRVAQGALQNRIQLLGLIWLIWQFAPSAQLQKRLMKAYVLGAFGSAFQTVWGYSQGTGRLSMGVERYAAEGFNPNTVGILLALSIPMAFYLVAVEKRGIVAWFWRIHCVIACFAILLTGSRTALLTTVAAVILLPWSTWVMSARRKIAFGVTAVAVVCLISIYIPQGTWKRLGTMDEAIGSGNFGGRGKLWMAGLTIFTEHPILGIGPSGFRVSVAEEVGHGALAHNVFLTVLVEHGLVGFAIYLSIYACLLGIILRLPALERRVFLAVLACWSTSAMASNRLSEKETWFVIGLIATQIVLVDRPPVPETARMFLRRLPMQPHGPQRTVS